MEGKVFINGKYYNLFFPTSVILKVLCGGSKIFKVIFCGMILLTNENIIWLGGRECVNLYIKGGLSIRSIEKVNNARLGKWLWRVGEHDQELWRQILIKKKKKIGL